MTKLSIRAFCAEDLPLWSGGIRPWNDDVPRWSAHRIDHDDAELLANIDSRLCEVDAQVDAALTRVTQSSDEPLSEMSMSRAKSLIRQVFANDCALSTAYVDEAGLMLRWTKDGWRFTAIVGDDNEDLTIQAVRFTPNVRLIFVPDVPADSVSEVLAALPSA